MFFFCFTKYPLRHTNFIKLRFFTLLPVQMCLIRFLKPNSANPVEIKTALQAAKNMTVA